MSAFVYGTLDLLERDEERSACPRARVRSRKQLAQALARETAEVV